MINGTNGTRSRRLRTSAIMTALYQKSSRPHHLLAIEPDIEIAAHTVDVCFGSPVRPGVFGVRMTKSDVNAGNFFVLRSEEHTSELQSRFDLVCRLLLEKK